MTLEEFNAESQRLLAEMKDILAWYKSLIRHIKKGRKHTRYILRKYR